MQKIVLSLKKENMKVKFYLPTIFLLLCISSLYAQQSSDEICNKFFEKYAQQNSDSALTYLFQTNKFIESYQDQTEDLKLKLKKIYEKSGKYVSNELVTKKTAGKNVIMMTFVVIHEAQPIIFRLTFFRPHDTWQISDFKFTLKIEDELEEASRIYRLQENIQN